MPHCKRKFEREFFTPISCIFVRVLNIVAIFLCGELFMLHLDVDIRVKSRDQPQEKPEVLGFGVFGTSRT